MDVFHLVVWFRSIGVAIRSGGKVGVGKVSTDHYYHPLWKELQVDIQLCPCSYS